MKFKNLHGGSIMFPIAEGTEVVPGAVYQITNGVAVKVEGAITAELFGVCQGGDKIEVGKIMLDIDPTSLFIEKYENKPTVGAFVDSHKLVVAVDEAKEEFSYLVRKQAVLEEDEGNDEGTQPEA